jgi:LAO/AO transport system kinase
MLVPSAARDDQDPSRPTPKRPEVLVTTAVSGEGVPELLAALDRHRASGTAGATSGSRRVRAAAQVRAVLTERIWGRLESPPLAASTNEAIEAVAGHDLDPFAAADRLLSALGTTSEEDA